MIEAQNDKMMQKQQQPEEVPNFSPSFSSYSSETLAEIAARVINELRLDPLQNDTGINDNDDGDSLFQPWEEEDQNDHFTSRNDNNENENDDNENENDDEDFSFALVSRDAETSPVSADDIFYNGQIKPMYNIIYPLFNYNYNNNNNAQLNDAVSSNSRQNETIRRRLPLRKLMFEERETASCSSSDESVDLEGVPEDTYCVWNANAVARDRKKSKSTGSGSSSKRWKLRELLLRSLSEGKGKKNNSDSNDNNCSDDGGDNKKRGFVFGVPGKRTSKVAAAKNGSGDAYGGAPEAREGKNGKKSVLPYRQELVGIFANVNGLGRNLHPF